MAKDEELRLRLTAKDEASSTIDKVATKVDKLDTEDVEINLTATDRAEAVIKDVQTRLQGLSADDQAIVLRASSGEFTKAVKAAQRDLKNLRDLSDDEVALRVRVIEENRAALTRIDHELDALDKRVVTPEVKVQQTGRAVAGLGSLSNALSSIPGEAGAAAGALGGAVTPTQALGAAAVVAGTALTKMANEFADTALEVDAFARNTGLSLDQASRFAAVADDLGIGIDGIGTAINKMQKNIGGGLLESLGLEQLRGKDTESTFLNIIGHLQAIDDEAKQAALGAQIFGKGFSTVSELALTDVDALRESLANVKPGQIYDASDVAKGKQLRDSADELADKWEIIGRELGEAFLPALVKAEDFMGELVESAHSLGVLLSKVNFEVPGLGGPGVIERTLSLGVDNIPLLGAMDELGVAFGKNVDNVTRLKAGVESIPVVGNVFEGLFGGAEANVDEAEEAIKGLDGSTQDFTKTAGNAERALKRKAEADEAAKQAAEEHAETEDRLRDSMEAVNTLIDERSGAILSEAEARVALTKSQTDFTESLKDEKKSTDERTVAAIKSAEAYADVLEAQAKANGQSFTTTDRNNAIKASLQTLAEQADGPTKDAINNVIAALDDVPESTDTTMTADNRDALAKINAVIRQLQIAQQEFAIMNAIANGRSIAVPGVPGFNSTSTAASTGNVIINMPAGANGSDVVAAQRRHARRNGALR
jgi:hypothetical protein